MFGNKEKKAQKEEKAKAANLEARKAMNKEIEEQLRKTIINKDTPFSISEAYKAARTNILFSLKNSDETEISKKGKSLIVTSANPGEGKSTNAINLAVAFAQTGDKVIIIDADMRKPRVHKYFKLKNKSGVSNILGGFEKAENCIHHDADTGLHIITAGHIPPNLAELLGSNEMDALLEKLSQTYDYIFVDTPPINVVTDAAVLSKKVSGVVLVVRHNMTGKDMVDRSVKTLEFAGAKILGFVLNSVEMSVYEGRYTYRSYRRSYKRYGYKRYGYGKYGYSRYGYKRYGYGKYGYGKYGYGKYGYGKYGYGADRYGDDPAEEAEIENNNTAGEAKK